MASDRRAPARRAGATAPAETLGLPGSAMALVGRRPAAERCGCRLPSAAVLGRAWSHMAGGGGRGCSLSENYASRSAVLLLYLGLLDGFVKLEHGTRATRRSAGTSCSTRSSRGALARFALSRQPIRLPPLSGWVLAFVLVVLVSAFNPGSYPIVKHGCPASARTWSSLPLFFFGFLRHARRQSGCGCSSCCCWSAARRTGSSTSSSST